MKNFRELPVENKTEIVKLAFSDRGLYINADWIYERNSALIAYTCSKGHQHNLSYANFNKGVGCAYCSPRPPKSTKTVCEEFAQAGFKIPVDWRYQNVTALIPFTCLAGHKHQLSYNKFQQGQRCLYCVGTPKHTTEYVVETFKKAGLTPFGDWTYKDAETPIPFRCSKGHNHQISYSSVKRGSGCVYCYSERPIKADKRTLKYGISRIVSRTRETSSGQTYKGQILTKWVRENIDVEVLYLYINYSSIKDNIDHVVPLSWFNLANEIELKAAWDIANLQVLPIVENKRKGNKLTNLELSQLSSTQKTILNIASLKPNYATL